MDTLNDLAVNITNRRLVEERAERDGVDACRAGQQLSDNPHPYGDFRHEAWIEGFESVNPMM